MSEVAQAALRLAVLGKTLDAKLADEFMSELMNGLVTPVQTAALVSMLAARGEQSSEIVGFARAMRRNALHIDAPADALDTCGTGGDGADTFNISTTVAFIAAADGIPVAKHGNRAASSRSGSADVLQALGAKIDLDGHMCESLLVQTQICFLFAPMFHPAMRHAALVRKELGFRTIFNILGPLTNPAATKRQVLGVFRPDLVRTVADALVELGVKRAMVVHGAGGLDELSISGPTEVAEVEGERVLRYTVSPEDIGLPRADVSELKGGSPEENAEIVSQILSGRATGAKRDVVLLNAGAALYVGGRAESLAAGVRRAAEIIDSKAALEKLNAFVALSHEVGQAMQQEEIR